ncbi:hypothetical protein ACH4ZU_11910 [Streptomyces sp. NPDC020472]|uniref:hypothetical protein n=1 Tax=Streptomyces sp. NPDC020472 TaxID=3365075 RepID=UPI0037A34ED3
MTTTPTKKAAPRRAPARKADPYDSAFADLKSRISVTKALDLPFRGGMDPEKGRRHFAEQAAYWRSFNEGREDSGRLGLDGVLLEDLYLALSTRTSDEAAPFLLNLAARIVQIVKSDAEAGK